ncbi:MAG TPA: type 2 isopentenyl-diphosphate Delta-isomerase [Methanobacterium sp.]|jgi:isopentenyl-diphosphate delta-isomerase|nr:MAG: type 2 isopentenyl-diphosphate Delta-isomerase [Methanobacterium sp.]HOI70903.1 type 2 isopentenyl-diphosphate Delta-isomerase [Methanobacterium sp.]HPX77633.1 type 2 isopentenyl-diphosphate Delta-isomerase [Methanobacterium sp.]
MISDRKLHHLNLCMEKDVEYRDKRTGFGDVELIHKALPGIDKEEISLETEFLGKKLEAPIIITGITGGHPASQAINQALAKAAEKLKIGMGMGSQRAAVENPELKPTYTIIRDEAPSTLIIGNIGAPQVEYAEKSAAMMDMDAMAIHLNPLQEVIQPEGDVNSKNYLENIKKAIETLEIPVIIKETGAGIKREDAVALEKAGAAAIDIAGAGGTSWAAVETYRSKDRSLGDLFWDWGIPTAVSTVEVLEQVNIPILASGGIRTGLDMAKAIALGADTAGIALPLLKEAFEGPEAVVARLEKFIEELKVVMYLLGASNLKELKNVDLIIQGKTRDWLQERGVETSKFARRSL